MELSSNLTTVMTNAGRYFMLKGNDIPAFQREKIAILMGPGVSPVDYIVKASEYLYAVAGELDNEGREIAAELANMASLNGWHEMTVRGNQMVMALRRANGEEVSQPEADDPHPKEEYLEPLGE